MKLGNLGLAERRGSGDGEGWTMNTRQMAFEPLPASVLFALVVPVVILMAAGSVWLLRTAETDQHLAVGSKCVVRQSRS
jgi:hypothetical protein